MYVCADEHERAEAPTSARFLFPQNHARRFQSEGRNIIHRGIYATIDENHCEGMVPMRDLGDDYYDFDEKNYCLIGRRHHKKFSLGDPVTIKVARANLEKKQLDFALVEK